MRTNKLIEARNIFLNGPHNGVIQVLLYLSGPFVVIDV